MQQTKCCGLIYDYKRATDNLKISIEKYRQSMNSNIGQFKGKTQQAIRRDFNTAQQEAYELLKDDQQPQARRLLAELFSKQKQDDKQGKLLARQIDFLTKKERALDQLKQDLNEAPKPKKKSDQRDQIALFKSKLENIQSHQFQNVDQISGDSDDDQAYVDKIIEDLKGRIEREQRAKVKPVSVVKQPPPLIVVPKELGYSSKEHRDRFLEKLRRSGSKSDRTFRKMTKQEIEFFRSKLSIQVGRYLNLSQTTGGNRNRQQNLAKRSSFGYDQDLNRNSSIIMSIPSQAPEYSYVRQGVSDEEVGYYLNCNGMHNLDVTQFVKGDWSVVEVLDLQECSITSFDWKAISQAKSMCLPNLKVLYLGLNQIKQVNQTQLQNLRGVRYLSFGWWDKSNQLSPQSKKAIANYQSRNPQIKIQFNQF